MGSDYKRSFCQMALIQYTGDQTLDQYVAGLGFEPDCVWIMMHKTAADPNAQEWFFRTSLFQANRSYRHTNNADSSPTDAISASDVDGFHVDDAGANANPNALGVVYDAICWRES